MQTVIHGVDMQAPLGEGVMGGAPEMESRKRAAMGQPDMEPAAKRGTEGAIIFRIAAPLEKTGPVIGKGGSVIKDIRESTGSKITIGDAPPGLQERGIVILSHDRPGHATCGAQDALDRVMSRLFEPDTLPGADGGAPPDSAQLVLLIDRAFIGIIVGKGGEHIKKIRETSGAQVSLKSKGQGSPLEGPHEETFIIEGPYMGVRIAARMLTDYVRESVASGTQASPTTLAIAHTNSNARGGALGGFQPPPPGPAVAPGAPGTIRTEYRMLIPDARVGAIIGKGGDRLRQLREQSRAEIKIDRISEGHPDRMVSCTSNEPAHAEYCAAAEGAMMVANRALHDRNVDAKTTTVTMRMLAKSAEMSAVLGVKGSIIRQVTMDTGARLHVLEQGNPVSASVAGPGEQVLEIMGLQSQVLEAVRIATMLFRGAMIQHQQRAASTYAPPPPAYTPPAPVFAQPPAYGGQPDPYGNFGQPPPAFGQQPYAPAPGGGAYDPYGAPPMPAAPPANPADPYAAYNYAYGQQAAAAAAPAYDPFSAGGGAAPAFSPPPPQAAASMQYQYPAPGGAAGGAPAAAPQYPQYSPPHSAAAPAATRGAGPPPANPAINTLYNPTISSTGLTPGLIRYSFMLPNAHIGTLLGARGCNVSAIRTTSGARIKVQDSLPGAQEREVEISGQPAQVSLAHTAVQTLISTGELPANVRT
uniref:K Homology domain-containing protein n=1 Tax=Chlamydomonas euryale TaxID=1486919 RepID=A0A7R9UZN0_9CHLO|mmetsp:Transcript_1098/g.3010  ORF Transcript_1098/g.3010 Transcript_1098/m.3010 type:complete len:698 (+) Transcript_1098:61-2154(+)